MNDPQGVCHPLKSSDALRLGVYPQSSLSVSKTIIYLHKNVFNFKFYFFYMAKWEKLCTALFPNGDHSQPPYCNYNDVANLTYDFNVELSISELRNPQPYSTLVYEPVALSVLGHSLGHCTLVAFFPGSTRTMYFNLIVALASWVSSTIYHFS